MVSILLPSPNRAREQANRVKCANNLRQIGLAAMMYANNEVRRSASPRTYFSPPSTPRLIVNGQGRAMNGATNNSFSAAVGTNNVARVVLPDPQDPGHHAGRVHLGGWSLYAKDGRLKYCYNLAGVHHFFVEAAEAMPAGQHQVADGVCVCRRWSWQRRRGHAVC